MELPEILRGGLYPSISGDGRFVSFVSPATNLVDIDTNNKSDIFIHDRQSGVTSLVSVKSDGAQANDWSFLSKVSGDGQYIAFSSIATNLVDGDTKDNYDIFLHNRITRETIRVSSAYDGNEQSASSFRPSISYDGRFVTFYSSSSNIISGTHGPQDVYRYDRTLAQNELASLTWDNWFQNGHCTVYTAAISYNGRFVVFSSSATNLVPGDYNGHDDIFVRDMGVVFDQLIFLPLISR